MKTPLTTLNKIIPQPQNQSAVNRVVEEGKEFINEDFRKNGFATEDFDGEENTEHLRNGDTNRLKIVSLFSYNFYGPSIGELATGMQQIQKVNNALNRFSAENVNLNKIYASTTLYGDIITQVYSDKTAKGVWTYNAELGCICPKYLTDNLNMLKFFKFRTDQIDTNASNENQESIDTSISDESNFTISKDHLTMKEESLGTYVPSAGENGISNVTLKIYPNTAIIKNIKWHIEPSSKASIQQVYSNGNVYNFIITPIELGNISVYPVINEGEGDIEYNFKTKGKSKTIVISKESEISSKISSCSISTLNTTLGVIKEEETNNYVAENNNYGTVTVNLICNDGTEIYNIHWYTDNNSCISLNIPGTNSTVNNAVGIITGNGVSNQQSFSVEVHPLQPGENIKVWCVINEGGGDIEYNIQNELSNIPKFTITDNTPTPPTPPDPEDPEEELESLNVDNILWYFRYTPTLITDAQTVYNHPFDEIVSSNVSDTTQTNKLFKFNTDNNVLIVYPHKSYIPSTSNRNDKFNLSKFMASGCYRFNIYIVLKNNYENLGNIIENDVKVQIEYKANTIVCSKDNSVYTQSEELNTPKIFWKYNENNSDGYIAWIITFEQNCDMNFYPSPIIFKIKKGDEVKYSKTYTLYCWDMLIQNTFDGDYWQLVNSNGYNMQAGRDKQRLYRTESDGRGLTNDDVFQGYSNDGYDGRRDIYDTTDLYIPCLLSVYENQDIKYYNSLSTEVISSSKGLCPTFKKGKENEGKLMNLSFNPSDLQTINGVKYYFTDTLDNDNYMSFSDRKDTYKLNFYECHYAGEYRNLFYDYLDGNQCIWIRVFKKQNNGIWGFNDIPYFIAVNYENIDNAHNQDVIKDIPICGIREILFMSKTWEFNNTSLIQPIFIYNNSDTTKKVGLSDNTGTLIDFSRIINYTLQPHEILYLPMTNYIYLDNTMSWQGNTGITCSLVSDFSNNSEAVIREYDAHDTNISNLLILYNQDSGTHILDTIEKQNQFDNYVDSRRQYGSIGSSKTCDFNELCPIFEISENINTHEVPVHIFFHLIQPETTENSVVIGAKTYPLIEYINYVSMNLTLETEEETKEVNLYEGELVKANGQSPDTEGILYGTQTPLYLKYREDNLSARVFLNGLYLDVNFKGNANYYTGSGTNNYYDIDDENLNHGADILYYTDFYQKTTYGYAPSNYLQPNDWYKDGVRMIFKETGSNYELYICVSLPLNALTSTYNNNTSCYDIDKTLLYLFRGDAPNSSAYDTLGHG